MVGRLTDDDVDAILGRRSITAERPGRARSLNGERNKHWRVHRKATEQERGEWHLIWLEAVLGPDMPEDATTVPEPMRGRVEVTATAYMSGVLADAGNHYPSVKAAIDAAVDAGLLVSDRGEHVARVIMEAPVRVRGIDARLAVTLREVGP
jgi:hypothetical protein